MSATLTWDAGGDTVSTFQEANWVVTDNTGQPGWTVGANPPAGTVNPSVDIQADTIVGGSATAGGPSGAAPHYDIGSGFSLTVQDNATFRMSPGSVPPAGIRGVNGGPAENVFLQDNSQTLTQFLLDLSVTMSDASELVLYGGGNPVNITTIEFASDWTGSLTFNDETVAAVTSEHLSKFTVGGDAAVIGTNVQLVSSGQSGSVLTVIPSTVIPEPASLAVGLLGLGGLCLRRRRG